MAKKLESTSGDLVFYNQNTTVVKCKTRAQEDYLFNLRNNTINFSYGCAGSGKTFLAVAYALSCLQTKFVKRVFITRPVVEAGERLGFLPGDMKQKLDPYLQPIYDAAYNTIGKARLDKLLEDGTIEICPLAFMRGRTLDKAIVILDEAQNTTPDQMKLFLTRLGKDSKMIITGDLSQIDLPKHLGNGLTHASALLTGLPNVAITRFTSDDSVRHPLVKLIVRLYEEDEGV